MIVGGAFIHCESTGSSLYSNTNRHFHCERINRQGGVWYKRINRFGDMMEDEQANAAGCFVEVPGVRHPLVKGRV